MKSCDSSTLVETSGMITFAGAARGSEGMTATGRATVQVLAMNDARRLDLRLEFLPNDWKRHQGGDE